jgi:hypothetical protein
MLMADDLLELEKLQVGEAHFIPTLRPYGLIAEAASLAENLRLRFGYRDTIVGGKYGVLFTRRTGRAGVINEDRKPS